jgi:hypothetical protein
MSIRDWWEGAPRESSHGFVFLNGTTRHWTSKWAHAFVGFLKTEWKWVVATVLAIIGLLIALKKL